MDLRADQNWGESIRAKGKDHTTPPKNKNNRTASRDKGRKRESPHKQSKERRGGSGGCVKGGPP